MSTAEFEFAPEVRSISEMLSNSPENSEAAGGDSGSADEDQISADTPRTLRFCAHGMSFGAALAVLVFLTMSAVGLQHLVSGDHSSLSNRELEIVRRTWVINWMADTREEQSVLQSYLCVVYFAWNFLILAGALRMGDMRNYGLARAVSVLSLFPCIFTCFPVSSFFGAVSLWQLQRPSVREAFRRNAVRDAELRLGGQSVTPVLYSTVVIRMVLQLLGLLVVSITSLIIAALVLPGDTWSHIAWWCVAGGVTYVVSEIITRRSYYRFYRDRTGHDKAKDLAIKGESGDSPLTGSGFLILCLALNGWAATKYEPSEFSRYAAFACLICVLTVCGGLWGGFVGVRGSSET